MADADLRSQVTNNNCINLVSFTILYYDYALTLSTEVERFWSSPSFSWGSTFFYLNRYLALFGHIPIVAQDFFVSDIPGKKKICALLSLYHQYLAVIIQVIVGILLIMRIHALYGRSNKVLLFLCACGLAAIVFGAWSVAASQNSEVPEADLKIACTSPLASSDAKRIANAWIGMFLFDSLIIGMTAYKSWRRGPRGTRSLFTIMLRDGTTYFGIMSIVAFTNIITFYVSPDYQRGFLTTFANVVSSTMMTRFMLNLRNMSSRYTIRVPVSRWHSTSQTSYSPWSPYSPLTFNHTRCVSRSAAGHDEIL